MDTDLRLAIIAVDGGVSSQIACVAYGLYLQEKFGSEIRVEYDLSWYDEFGCDGNAKFARHWNIPQAFPGLELKVADAKTAVSWSRWFGQKDLERTADLFLPAYLNGYPREREACVYRYREVLRSAFRPELTENTRAVADRIVRCGHACGVHVRRGDLANGNPGYGKPTSVGYYVTAAAIIRGLDPEAEFFFFSEEPEWVASELLPKLPSECKAEIVTGNSSDRGYEDLYLLTQCDYIISSIGSFGSMAAILSDKYKWLVMSRRRTDVLDRLEHCIYVNDDRQEPREMSDGRRRAEASWGRRVAYRLHAMGLFARRLIGQVDEPSYRLNLKRLQFKYL